MRLRAHVPLLVVCLALAAARPARAQLSNLTARVHTGLAVPFGPFSDSFSPGVSVQFDVGYPVEQRLDALLDLGLDYVNGKSGTYVPDTHLWRAQLQLEGDLLGDRDARFRVRPFAGAGAVYFHTKDFQIDGSTPADRSTWTNKQRRDYPGYLEKIEQVYFLGSGGLRLALDAGDDVTWWLSGEMTWSPVGSAEETLRRVPLSKEQDRFKSATDFGLTLGLTVWRP